MNDQQDLTQKDFENLNLNDRIRLDKRSFCEFTKNQLTMRHPILKAFVYISLLSPQKIRITMLFVNICILFALNAVFYSDEDIINSVNVNSIILNQL